MDASPSTGTSRDERTPVTRRFTVTTVAVRELFLEGILDLFAGLFQIALRLIILALRLELLVADALAGGFLDLALGDLCGVLGLVVISHVWSPFLSQSRHLPSLNCESCACYRLRTSNFLGD